MSKNIDIYSEAFNLLRDKANEIDNINFEKLESEGIIKSIRGGYEVIQFGKLPEEAKQHIKKITPTKNGVKVILYKYDDKFKTMLSKFK
ncbi:hypothetical protein [Lonsdalea quercina]|uniref:hypothetical protein n=1 Tax=Lonsdalea quercina TaxID=71657 RepID=UPI003976F5F7